MTTQPHPSEVDHDEVAATEPIGSGLGEVVVGRSGRLLAVTIDQSLVRGLRAELLGELVTEAVNRAESRVRGGRDERGARP